MSQPVQPLDDVSEQSLVWAIEQNVREFLLEMGRVGGGEERDDGEVQWMIGGSPVNYHNCVVRANLTEETADRAIEASIERMQALKVPGSWHVGPSMQPADLGERLLAHGFVDGGPEPGMAADLQNLNEQVTTPAGFVVEQVANEEDLQVWARTLGMGFGAGEIEGQWVGEVYGKIGFDEQGTWQHFLGRWDGEPVATTTLFLGAGVAGIFFVFTLPLARRQGIGAAITLAALQDARRRGYRIGILGASSMGYPVYQRLGFREYCQFGIYEWQLR